MNKSILVISYIFGSLSDNEDLRVNQNPPPTPNQKKKKKKKKPQISYSLYTFDAHFSGK
jgi:hypothetical protein